MAKVTIEVLGGVAQITRNPDNVEVEIIDHDNENDQKLVSDCHLAPVEYDDRREYYTCTACGDPCDIEEEA